MMVLQLSSIVLWLSVSAGPAVKQEASSWRNSQVVVSMRGKSMPAMIEILAGQTGKSFAIDDVPLRTSADVQFTGTADKALDLIAGTFDYTWDENKQGVIVMRKRFATDTERPQMCVTEIEESCRELVRILESVSPIPNGREMGSVLRALYASFTPEQLQVMHAGQRLDGRDLSPEQRKMLWAATVHAALGRLYENLELIFSKVQGYRSAELKFGPWRLKSSGPDKPALPDTTLLYLWRAQSGVRYSDQLLYERTAWSNPEKVK